MSSYTPHLHPGRPELQLTFCERTLSPISTTISDSIETTSSSYATADGLGTDFGRFLNWIGTRLLDAVIEIVIQRRLSSIATYISHRGRDQVQLNEDPGRLQAACADLLELCRPIYAMKVRRKSMGLISALFHPVDHISILILHSDFVEVLAALEIDCCGADDMVHTIVDIVHIANNVRSLSCHCILCLQRFNRQASLKRRDSRLFIAPVRRSTFTERYVNAFGRRAWIDNRKYWSTPSTLVHLYL